MIRQFHKPSTIEDALALKKTYGNTVTWFSGGAYINQITFGDHCEQVICLEQLQLDTIQESENNLEIGSTVTLQEILDHDSTPGALKQAVRNNAPRTFRNLATIGGDIATGGKTTQLTPCLIALNARLVTDREELSIEDYLNQNQPDLIIKLIIPKTNRLCNFLQVLHKANADPVCSVAVSMESANAQQLNDPIIVIGAVEPSCRRLTELEDLLKSGERNDFNSICTMATDLINPPGDITGSTPYKKYISGQAVAECILSILEGGV